MQCTKCNNKLDGDMAYKLHQVDRMAINMIAAIVFQLWIKKLHEGYQIDTLGSSKNKA